MWYCSLPDRVSGNILRFGIEMVPIEPEGPCHMEEDIDVPLSEGFHWDSLADLSSPMVPARKRSMSESSVVINMSAASSSLLDAAQLPSGSALRFKSIHVPDEKDCDMQNDSLRLSPAQEPNEPMKELKPLKILELLDEESSSISGTEQNDLQSGGKKRRAVGVSGLVLFSPPTFPSCVIFTPSSSTDKHTHSDLCRCRPHLYKAKHYLPI